MADQHARNHHAQQPSTARHLWIWFLVGFMIVLVVMALTVTIYTVLPSGRGVLQCKLWQYYVAEVKLSFRPGMGPATGNASALVVTASEHLLCSAAGGLGMLGVGWGFHKIRKR